MAVAWSSSASLGLGPPWHNLWALAKSAKMTHSLQGTTAQEASNVPQPHTVLVNLLIQSWSFTALIWIDCANLHWCHPVETAASTLAGFTLGSGPPIWWVSSACKCTERLTLVYIWCAFIAWEEFGKYGKKSEEQVEQHHSQPGPAVSRTNRLMLMHGPKKHSWYQGSKYPASRQAVASCINIMKHHSMIFNIMKHHSKALVRQRCKTQE